MENQQHAYAQYPEVTRSDFPELRTISQPRRVAVEKVQAWDTHELSTQNDYSDSPKSHTSESTLPDNYLWGLPRQKFWAIATILLVASLAFLGTGIGAGFALRGSLDGSASSDAKCAQDEDAAASGSNSTSDSSKISCPASNGAIVTAPSSGKTFLVLCGRDYGGKSVATDIANNFAADASGCMTQCAKKTLCTGATYTDWDAKCWMKTAVNLTAPSTLDKATFMVRLN